MSGFRDIHSHFVYGVDDGARSIAEMYAMLDSAHEQGITTIIATPHVTPGLERFDEDVYLQRLDKAREYCRDKGYEMELEAGAEHLYTPAMDSYLLHGELRTLGESDLVLVEFAPDMVFSELERALDRIAHSGYRPVLAHVERYDCLYWGRNAKKLKESFDALFQMNCSSVISEKGFFRKRRIWKWLEAGLVDFVASDAHGFKRRPFRMQEAHECLAEDYGQEEADRLTGRSGAPCFIG